MHIQGRKKAYSRNPGLCLCSTWGPNWIWAWIPANSQALSKETGWEPLSISSLAWRRHERGKGQKWVKWRAETHIQEGRMKLQRHKSYPIFAKEIPNEHLIVCLECSVVPERASSKWMTKCDSRGSSTNQSNIRLDCNNKGQLWLSSISAPMICHHNHYVFLLNIKHITRISLSQHPI